MFWVNVLALILLILSLFGGLKEGAVRVFFSFAALLIAIWLSGHYYHLLANILAFLPGPNWSGFLAFFITTGIVILILSLVFLLPRKLIQAIWGKGLIYRLGGAILNLLSTATSLAVFTLVISVYPIFGWLARAVTGASLMVWLVEHLSFVPALLPELSHKAVIGTMWMTLMS